MQRDAWYPGLVSAIRTVICWCSAFWLFTMSERGEPLGIQVLPYLVFGLVCYFFFIWFLRKPRAIPVLAAVGAVFWIAGSVIGSLLGAVLPFSSEGIDFALTALFLTVFVEQWLRTKNHMPALVGIFASVLCLALFGADRFLIPAMLLITLALALLRKQTDAQPFDRSEESERGGERP